MSIALYRRFRPEAFNEVIGQEQVTVPLMAALRAGKINHAYLFSGPRGCGKTTSARILARTLNCHANTPETPIDTPCGVCESCVELSRLGAGSLDVVEIDAASHGGVDAARDLRERATFTPSRDRFKIFIIDEAHMVTKEGFNALLKVVEEPPPHIKFIFATTEPDKVLGTIRSRTHHYPFRLVPSEVLAPYLENLTALEGATLGPGVVPLVIKAGGGSVRDSLSVLDQLIAGSVDGAVTYDRAVALLGYTPAAMLDEAIEALAAQDGASLFQVIDRVIENGNPPARFAEDLLQRIRDLIVVSVTGAGAAAVFRDWAADDLALAQAQAAKFDLGTLTRLGETISSGLSTMVGATSPRLQLELLCARLLVPLGPEQLAARLTTLEKTIATGTIPIVPAPAAAEVSSTHHSAAPAEVAPRHSADPVGVAQNPENQGMSPRARAAAMVTPTPATPPPTAPAPPTRHPAQAAGAAPSQDIADAGRKPNPPAPPGPPTRHPAGPVGAAQDLDSVETMPQPAPATGNDLENLKADWADLVKNIPSPVTRSIMQSSLGPVAVDGDLVQVGFNHPTLAGRLSDPKQADIVGHVLSEKLGRKVKVEGVAANGEATSPRDSALPEAAPRARRMTEGEHSVTATAAWQEADEAWLAGESIPLKAPAAPEPPLQTQQETPNLSPASTPVGPASPRFAGPEGAAQDLESQESQPRLPRDSATPAVPASAQNDEGVSDAVPLRDGRSGVAASESREGVSAAASGVRPQGRTAASEDEADPDDAVADQTFLSGVPLVVEMLAGRVINEEPV